ncbi:hypothetical protein [Legionella tunisiensis]|uniref:hypothetical protein n=1 Tax=Legionella tunisiensis TaxID=1034944 RepID=UPI0003143955|nr:hypothetical protein [Legionella tunisiensis]
MKFLQCEHHEAWTSRTVLGIDNTAQSDLLKGITVANEAIGAIAIRPAKDLIIIFSFFLCVLVKSSCHPLIDNGDDTKSEQAGGQ